MSFDLVHSALLSPARLPLIGQSSKILVKVHPLTECLGQCELLPLFQLDRRNDTLTELYMGKVS
jgi:hypothetical protein